MTMFSEIKTIFPSVFRPVLLLVTFLLPALAGAQYRDDYKSLYDSETAASLRESVNYLSSADLKGRAPGSDGEKSAAQYVYDRLEAYGVEMLCPRDGDTFGIAVQPGDTIVSRNVIGFVQGYDKALNNKYIVVGARLDNLGVNRMTVDGEQVEQIYYGANGNASGLAMLTELARLVATNSIMFRRSVLFVAFGASTNAYSGSWYFLNRSFSDAGLIDAMVNLDMLGTGDTGFYAYTASNADLNAILRTVGTALQPIVPEIVAAEPYPSDHRSFYAQEIPSVYLTTGRYPEKGTYRDIPSIVNYDYMERELEYIYNLTLEMANTGTAPLFKPSSAPLRGEEYADVVSINDCDVLPSFYNSTDLGQFLSKWVYQYLRYPAYAIDNGIQGRVILNFVIEKDGRVNDVRVVRGVDASLDEEAVRVVSASPKWKPGKIKGNKVRTSITLPVEFRLEKKGGKPSFGIKKY